MKKIGVLVLLVAILVPLISASNDTKINQGFACLEEKVGNCNALSTQEIALTILATPNSDKVYNDCLSELKKRQQSNNWGNVRDTALAILALKHSGQETKLAEEWLLGRVEIPTEIIWYLQQDSEGETECRIGYKSNDYLITIGENKKINQNAGSCLTRAQSNYWLAISPECLDNEFKIECNKDYVMALLYKNKNSPTIYVTKDSVASPAYSSVTAKVNSKCFGQGSCDYEGTLWASLALLKSGYNIEEFIPYIVAMSDSNKRFLPNSFIYMITNYDAYATKLVEEQKLGNYWEADGTAYSRFYDSALANLAIKSSSSETVTKTREWLLFSQKSDGCWNNIRDTAIVLWSLEGRAGKKGGGGSVEYCTKSNFFCIPRSDCPTLDDLGQNYYCASPTDTCCKTENLKKCSELYGKECKGNEVCTGNIRKTSDIERCCTGECVERTETTECELMTFRCSSQCMGNEESIDYACNSGQLCCRTKSIQPKDDSDWWLWLILVLILVVAAAIAYVKRERLKLEWFKLKTRFRKDKGGGGRPLGPGPGGRPPGAPAMPPRGPPRFPPHTGFPAKPGFPPIRRPQEPAPPRKPMGEDKEMAEVFKKLRDMSEK
jgi:hypothetical protein